MALVFFPSFSFLRKCVAAWQDDTTWDRLYASKGEVVVEPSGSSQAEFEKAKDTFNGTVERTKNCILLAVFRGKMSEGVSFNDDYARGVICVGVPLPSNYDRSISAKKAYNDGKLHSKMFFLICSKALIVSTLQNSYSLTTPTFQNKGNSARSSYYRVENGIVNKHTGQ